MNGGTLSIGFSPCPNDTYIFSALVHGKITAEGMAFNPVIEDVERLNQMAMSAALDITKASYHAFGFVRDRYCLLRSGGALGRGCGPLIVARDKRDPDAFRGKRIAVPGTYTTAFLLLRLFDPALAEHVVHMPFHRIMEAVQQGDVEAGVIIHEGRFTFRRHGLQEICDLGVWWQRETGLPIPLGAVLARRTFSYGALHAVEAAIRESIRYAARNGDETMPFIRAHAQEMADTVIRQHIALYVNRYSEDIGKEGESSVRTLLDMAEDRRIFPRQDMPLFCGSS